MRDEFFWSLLGGVVATLFNVLYNYVRETRNRRWSVAAEISGEIDFYYQRLVKLFAHLESIYEDEQPSLTKAEYRSIKMDSSALLIDEQKTRAKVDIVYGVNSYESNQFDEILELLKHTMSIAISISEKYSWIERKRELKESMDKIALLRPEYRKNLVNKSKLWPIFTSHIN